MPATETSQFETFEEFPYERPDLERVLEAIRASIARFKVAENTALQYELLEEINQQRQHFSSMYNLSYIRHTLDTRDAFYEAENTFFDEHMPHYQAVVKELYDALLEKTALIDKVGPQVFRMAELQVKTFRPEILEDLQQENKYTSQYIKLKGGAQIELEGETYNLSSIISKEEQADRTARRKAQEAKWAFYAQHQPEVDTIYDQLVQFRYSMAKKLGYSNHVRMAYDRLGRADYGPEQVAEYRKQIREHIVPLATHLYERQRQRLGLDRLLYYDEDFRFRSGNPHPKGPADWIVEQADRMYSELSSETKTFFQDMQQKHLMDLVNRDGKSTGGYCTFIPEFGAPFIFSNFNGTSADIDVLTHEAGHAFQVYATTREEHLPEYQFPTYEAAEIHSMSMEFFTWPWMELFFGSDTAKYRFGHLAGAVKFLPYGAAVDEFQHFVYENPDCGPEARNAKWKELEATYLPHREYDGHSFLESGRYWQKQSHIFASPFYYIDYTLAQVVAFQYWAWDQKDHGLAWESYMKLCRAGGRLSFTELLELGGLDSPFESGTIEKVIKPIAEWLEEVDDSTF